MRDLFAGAPLAAALAGAADGFDFTAWLTHAIQAGWLVLALALSVVMWRAGLRRYSAVGG